jgi:NADH:ubiquinone oxidoreductase subunit 6 (subunit J)
MRRMGAAAFAALWAFLLVLLASLLAGMGGYVSEVAVYYGAIGVFAVFVLATWLATRRNRLRAGHPRATPGGGTMILLAAGIVVAGMGFAFGYWLTVCSTPLFVLAGLLEVYTRRKRLPAG